MGSASSTLSGGQAQSSPTPSAATANGAPASPLPSACPMSEDAKRATVQSAGACPVSEDAKRAAVQAAPRLPAGCPMSDKTNADVATVQTPLVCTSDTELDPKNLMYAENQRPHPDQDAPLSVDRQTSSIPQAGASRNWVYPSPQMFYNAMKKKGWEPKEEDMDVVVAIHNNVNERTWHKVMAWESLHCNECANPQLVRFCGRPTELTPKARLNTWLGREAPFDRHDWVVDRCGREVRYVIDFYAYDPGNGLPPTTLIDARPALDSFESFVDRFRMRYWVLRQRYWPVKPPTDQIATQPNPTAS